MEKTYDLAMVAKTYGVHIVSEKSTYDEKMVAIQMVYGMDVAVHLDFLFVKVLVA